jgi:predicted DNA-binding ribbon-helix-helix protein
VVTANLVEGFLSPNGELKLRSVMIKRRRTTIRMDDDTWDALHEIARRELITLNDVCSQIAAARPPELSLTVALRVFALRYFRDAATENGHVKAGHNDIRRVRQIAEQLKAAGY